MKKKHNYLKVCLLLAAVAVCTLVIGNTANKYYITVLNAALIFTIAAFGLSLMMGMGGMMSFATVSFMGIGAYGSANFCMQLGIHPVFSVILATLVTVVVAGLFGLLLLRLKGAYFSFATIGIVQVTYALFLNYKPLTGGPNGLPNIPKMDLWFMEITTQEQWFYFLAIVITACAFALERIRRTSLGRSLAAIRDNELVAKAQGIDIYRTKLLAFMISGLFGGLAGGLYAHMNAYLSAYLFTYDVSVKFLVMVMLGGVNSTVGVIVGTLLVSFIPEWARPLESYMKLIYGVAIILLMIFMPMGIVGVSQHLFEKAKKSLKRKRSIPDESRNMEEM